MAIAAYAMQIPTGYVFLRYAYEQCAQHVERAIAEAKAYLRERGVPVRIEA